jgi:hypothetical protein
MIHWTVETTLMAGAALMCMTGCAMLATRAVRRARLRRRREALQDAGLRLAFDACAPEGADLSLEPFRLGRLRGEHIDGGDPRRRD